MIKTLCLLPLGAMQSHHFLFRQGKFKFPPHHAPFAIDGEQLIKRNKVFMFITANFNTGRQQTDAIVRVLCETFPHRCCFKFHSFRPWLRIDNQVNSLTGWSLPLQR